MPSLKELRDELRQLRKENPSHKPISKLKKGDVAAEIQKMREMREETAPVASTKGAPVRKSQAAVESVKKAKESEFPVKPSKAAVALEKPKPEASKSARVSKAILRRMVDELTSDED